MGSVYPGGLDSFSTTHQDNVGEIIHAGDIDNLADASNKIEATLGVNPQGTFSTVAGKLNALYYGTVTTFGEGSIPSGHRPPGLMVFNSTTNRYEYNAGTDVTPNWQPVGPAGPWNTSDIVDGAITSAKIADGTIVNVDVNSSAAIAYTKLNLTGSIVTSDLSSSVGVVPTGTVLPYAASTAPTGFLLCNGAAVSRTTYGTLFGIISTTYGVGDGSTTFNVPDLIGRVTVGVSSAGPTAINALGKNEGVTVNNRNISHHHTDPNDAFGTSGGFGGATSTPSSTGTGTTSGDTNNLNNPAYLVLNYIIRT